MLNQRFLQELLEVLDFDLAVLFNKNALSEPSGEFAFLLDALNRQIKI